MMGDPEGCAYVIRVREELGPHWTTRFPDVEITTALDGGTVFSGSPIDQAALHGLLSRIRDLGLTIVSVEQRDRPNDSGADRG